MCLLFPSLRVHRRAKRAKNDFCMWCDKDAMTKALSTDNGKKAIRQALTCFEETNEEVFEKALLSLPVNFYRGRSDYCSGPNCVFNSYRPGKPAYISDMQRRPIACAPGAIHH